MTAPATSAVSGLFSAREFGTKRRESSAAAMPIGRLMKKTQRQESVSVSRPPSTRPTAPPPAAIALQMPSAFVRSAPSAKVVVTIERAAGETSAAPRPCSARPPTSTPDDVAIPLIERRDGEDDHAGDEEPLPSEQVGRAAAEQEEAAEDERVRVDDPLQARRAEVQAVLDRRQGDVHDRRVENDHELRNADEDEDEPAVRLRAVLPPSTSCLHGTHPQ